ncbi:MAG: NusG domain II-containing protein [Clostridia bacterium]|nr:NusG domain II-containing protein [Clostridia bacterium]
MKNIFGFFNFKKGDIIVFLVIGIMILGSAVTFYKKPTEASVVRIYRNSEEYASYSLSQSYAKNVHVPTHDGPKAGYNQLRIENGTVTIVGSTCPNRDCMRMGSISKEGDILICLPHRLVVRLEGGDAIDAVSY